MVTLDCNFILTWIYSIKTRFYIHIKMRKTICWNDMTLTFECFFNSIPQLMKLEQNENHNSPTRQLFRDFSGLGMTIEELAYFLDAAQLYCPLELIRQPGNIILHIIYCSPCKPLRCISCWISLKNVAADDYSEFAQALVTVKIFSHLLIACDSLFMNRFFFVKRNVHIIILYTNQVLLKTSAYILLSFQNP